jgi:protein-glutamine gamma-glutamyltransferase
MAAAATVTSVGVLPAERFFRASLLLLIFTSVCTLSLTGKLDPFTALLAPAAVIYKGFRWWRGRPNEMRNSRATWLVVAYLGFFPLDVFVLSRLMVVNSANPPLYAALIGAVHFLIFVMLVRLYSAVTDRDAVFLTMLAFAGILASAVLTVDTTFLFCFFAFLIFGVATFTGMELRRAAQGAVTSVVQAGQTEHERRLNRALGYASLSVALGAIVIGGTLFFFFPRFSAGYLGRTSFNPALMTGFNDDVELGQIGEIKKDSTIVMRVETGQPVGYPRLRWRGIALANFDGKRWSSAERGAETLSSNSEGWIYLGGGIPRSDTHAPGLIYTVYLEPIASDAIFVPGKVVSLRGNFNGEPGSAYNSARKTYLFRDSAGSLYNPAHNYTAVRYAGFSRLPVLDPAKLRAAGTDYPEDITRIYLQLPTLDRRIAPLAEQITARAATPYDKVATMELYLRTKFGYTLQLTGKPGDDPLAHFLFETRAGHCEYFASSMTVMLRTLGIPAREVNGFLPGEFNDLGGDYVVRASDAHSWVEVFFPGNGWVTFDPTPAGPENAGGFLSRLGQYLDWISLTWNEWVISYDFAHQVVLAQNLKSSSRNWSDSLRAWFEKKQQQARGWMKDWEFQHSKLRYLLPVALVFFLVVLRVDMIPELIRRLKVYAQMRIGRSEHTNPQLAARLYSELCRVLHKRGISRLETQTPLEFAAAVGDARVAPAVREFTEIYGKARFGEAPCNAVRLRELISHVRGAFRSR